MTVLQQWHLAASRNRYGTRIVRLNALVTCMCSLGRVALASETDRSVEEVIVSARKVNERLQDVPVTVSAVTGEALRKSGAADVKDVLGSIPGLSFTNVERGQSKYTIRGINSAVTTPTTGIYLDDISLITNVQDYASGAFDPILFDLERVEVLKGPQGTLYGGSSMGGAIKYVTARPNLSVKSGSISAGFGTVEHGAESYQAQGVLNLPLIEDVLGVRGGFYYLHEGGYVDNIAGQNIVDASRSSTSAPLYTPLSQPSLSTQSRKDYNFSNSYVGRLSLLWQPDPSWSISPTVYYQKSTQENPPYFLTNVGGLTSSYRYVTQKNPDEAGIYSLNIQKTMGQIEVTSLTAYVDRDATWFRDYSFYVGGLLRSLYSLNSIQDTTFNHNNFSQELRVASAPGSGARLDWLAGVYYSDQKIHRIGDVPVFGSGFPNGDRLILTESTAKLKQTAAFGEATLHLTNALDLIAGARFFEFKQTIDFLPNLGLLASTSGGVLESKENGVNPKIGLSYKVSADHLLYASASKGFRPGGPNGPVTNPLCGPELAAFGLTASPASLESDSLWTYEVGSKNEVNGGRMMLNGSLYYSDWKDIQQTIRLPLCGGAFNTNAGAARVRGAEVEARINLGRAWQLGGNASFVDAKITDGGTGTLTDPAGALPQAGDTILETPRWIAGAYASYSIHVNAAWEMEAHVDYRYRGKQRNFFDDVRRVKFPVNGVYPGAPNGTVPYAESEIYQQSYDVVNAFVSFDRGSTAIRLYVNNALDEQPFLDPGAFTFIGRANTLRPRTMGVEFTQQF